LKMANTNLVTYSNDFTYTVSEAKYISRGDRVINEDYLALGSDANGFYYALADGMGGEREDMPSKVACRIALNHMYGIENDSMNSVFTDIYRDSNKSILDRKNQEHYGDMSGTTLNLTYIGTDKIYWSHIGNSRTYYFKNYKLENRTLDHSISQFLLSAGIIKDADLRNHSQRNKLLKALGYPGNEMGIESERELPITGCDQLLMCSDGFWELITDEEMQSSLEKSDNPNEWLNNMLKLIDGKRRSKDNLSAIAIWINGAE